jgi:hypothetical protein
MSVRHLTNADRGIDCFSVIEDDFALWLPDNGYTFVVRYFDNLHPPEMSRVLKRGLGLVGVRACRANGWMPNAAEGKADSLSTSQKATGLGFEAGATIGCDLEGCNPITTVADAMDYCSAWPTLVRPTWPCMLYVGAGQILNGAQLYSIPGFELYWRSCSLVPDLSCGYALIQTRPGNTRIGPNKQWLVDINQPETDWHNPPRSVTAMFA